MNKYTSLAHSKHLLFGTLRFAILFLLIAIVQSCGKDRSSEYYELTEHNTWVYGEMRDKYLWGDAIKEPTWKEYFGTVSSFFRTLTNSSRQNDKWSYCLVDSAMTDPHLRGNFNHLDSYGLDFTTMTDPTGATSRTLVRVTMVVKDSPAYRCGLRRNDFIGIIDGERVTNSNATAKLQNGTMHRLECYKLGTTDDSFVWEKTFSVEMPASEYVEENAFPVFNVVHPVNGATVAYLQCTRLIAAPDKEVRTDTPYTDRLAAIMSQIKSSSPTDMVLDLRFCNYGTIDVVQQLASYIVAPDYLGADFCSTAWNDRYATNNQTYRYDASLAPSNLNLSRLFVLVSNYTQGAPEWLIHSLRATMGVDKVFIVGERTQGQGVMTQHISSGFGHQLYPAVAYVYDSKGEFHTSPIIPDTLVNENSSLYNGEYGDQDEPLFRAAIERILR